MPIYNVTVSLETTMVVVADDEDHAYRVAQRNAREAFDDDRSEPDVSVRGQVTNEKHLHGGWDGDCIPYGGNGNARIAELLHRGASAGTLGQPATEAYLPATAPGLNWWCQTFDMSGPNETLNGENKHE